MSTMGAALFVLGIFLFLNHNISRVLQGWEDDPDVSIFLEDELTDEETRDIARGLGDSAVVDTYSYLSRDDALRLFEEAFPAARGLAGSEGLPASFEVRLVESAPRRDVDELLEVLASRTDVEEVVGVCVEGAELGPHNTGLGETADRIATAASAAHDLDAHTQGVHDLAEFLILLGDRELARVCGWGGLLQTSDGPIYN